ncbi:MAG: hypothetical protein K2Q15_04015 [Burkholderiales bacterium]|nr:hypothetical protein [Burkholderiales bacterium]
MSISSAVISLFRPQCNHTELTGNQTHKHNSEIKQWARDIKLVRQDMRSLRASCTDTGPRSGGSLGFSQLGKVTARALALYNKIDDASSTEVSSSKSAKMSKLTAELADSTAKGIKLLNKHDISINTTHSAKTSPSVKDGWS